MKLGTETNSVVNHLMSKSDTKPEIGMGVTMLGWTDRHPGTIIKMTPKTITVQEDTATRIDKNGMSESQQYEYTPDPDGRTKTFRLTKNGWRETGGGNGLLIGVRKKYHDYNF